MMKLRRFSTSLALLSLLMPILTPLLPTASAASAPSIYFASSTVSAAKGSTFSVALRLNTNGVAVNAANVIVSYPESQLSFAGLDKGGSYFDTFLPAAPAASGGKLNFSAASLASQATSSDVLIGTLSFVAKTDSGSASIDLSGSQVANNGAAIDVTPSSSKVTFNGDSPAGGNSSVVGISGVSVTDVSLTGGIIRWKTAVAATSSVDYGADGNYGLSAGNSDLSTSHVVDLGSKFAAKSAVHFRVTSVDAQGNRQSSADQIFTTLGYTVRIQVTDKQAQPQAGVSVTVGGSRAVTTDAGGYATISNVAAGSQKVTIDGKSQSITVKALTGAKAATTPQQFKLVATPATAVGLYVGIILVVLLLVALGTVLYRRPNKAEPTS